MNKIILVIFLIITNICSAQYLQKGKALEDLNEFKELLETQSSYFQLSDFNFEHLFMQLKTEISTVDSISIYQLAYKFEKIISETIDRHASVKIEDFDEDDIEMFNLHFPFTIAALEGKAVALTQNKHKINYEYYSKEFPFLKSINKIPTLKFIEQYAYRRKNSPKAAKLYDGLRDIRDIGELFFKQGELYHTDIDVVLTNGKKDTVITLPLSKKKNRWNNIGSAQDYSLLGAMYFNKPFEYNKLDKWLDDSIAYIQFPMMISYDDYTDFETYLQTTVGKYKDAHALVIDIRGNGGGERDILNTLAGYIVQPEQSPWVANVAYIRNDQQLDEDIESMKGRYLYNYNSQILTDIDRKAIDKFNTGFKTELTFDSKKFSNPFYMVLKSNEIPLKCPVYLLVNEACFSAASVFTTAFKGLGNVTIAGVTTNGSSGRSVKFHLSNSNIRIKLSTMLSFQRNGKTLDGNGTVPDIIIEMDEDQVFGEKDTQLERLLELINHH